MTYQSDKCRIEAALPAAMLYRCYDACAATAADRPDAGEMGHDRLVLKLLQAASLEPLAGLDAAERRKLSKRVDRVQATAMLEYEDRPVMLVFLVVLFWLTEILDAERLTLVAGSSFDQAVEMLLPALEGHADLWEKMSRSAGRNARKLGVVLNEMGYYR